jgi:hypothetical protein
MLFFLLVVTPIAIIVWLLVKLFRPKSRITFDRLAEGIGVAICMIWVVGLMLGGMAYAVFEIFWQYPWLLYIVIPGYIIAGLVCLIKYFTTKAQQREGQAPT